MIKRYNKLVRDRIPEIISAKGDCCKTRVLSDDEYAKMLDLKLDEECAEYQADKSVEELADVLEVIYAIAKNKGLSTEELNQIRLEKAEKRGSFNEKILLIETESN